MKDEILEIVNKTKDKALNDYKIIQEREQNAKVLLYLLKLLMKLQKETVNKELCEIIYRIVDNYEDTFYEYYQTILWYRNKIDTIYNLIDDDKGDKNGRL